jgi:hypothetical protein
MLSTPGGSPSARLEKVSAARMSKPSGRRARATRARNRRWREAECDSFSITTRRPRAASTMAATASWAVASSVSGSVSDGLRPARATRSSPTKAAHWLLNPLSGGPTVSRQSGR